MGNVFLDLALLGLCIIAITATVGVISSTIGLTLFGRGKQNYFIKKSAETQTGWKTVGRKS